MNNIVEVENLRKAYGDFTLGPLNFSIPEGVIVGYIGENGAGKSTTMKLLLNLIKPDEGEAYLFGQPIESATKELFNRVGVVFDRLNLPEELTLKQTGTFCKYTYSTWEQAAFVQYLRRFSLPEKKKIKSLSHGMKVKLAIAIALSHGAKLLLLDEATSGLDPFAREEILDVLRDFIQDETCSIFISSHILSDLEKIADYIALLHKGQLVFIKSKEELLEEYAILAADHNTASLIESSAIISHKRNRYGQQLLVKRSLVPPDLLLDRPTIEEIMLFFVKGA